MLTGQERPRERVAAIELVLPVGPEVHFLSLVRHHLRFLIILLFLCVCFHCFKRERQGYDWDDIGNVVYVHVRHCFGWLSIVFQLIQLGALVGISKKEHGMDGQPTVVIKEIALL